MAQNNVMSGPRALVKNAATGKIIVSCDNISYNSDIARQPVDVLGNFLTQEHVPVGVTINGTLSGFRIPGQPPELMAGALMPLVQQLLSEEPIVISVEDRQSGSTIATILGVKIGNWGETVGARELERWTASFVGIVIQREGAPNSETGTATSIFNP